MTARPEAVWEELERRERAFVAGDARQLDRLEQRPPQVGSPRWRACCYQRPVAEDPQWNARRFDPQYETSHDGVAPGPPLPGLVALLDDLRSQWNVGAIFRTADGAGWGALHLCGITPMPPAAGLLRVSLGAERHVPWSYRARVVDAVEQLIGAGFVPVALEQTADAQDLFQYEPDPHTVLIVGSEVAGVSREALHLCRRRLRIPMAGHKASLNAAVAFGIAAFALRQRYVGRG